MTKPVTKLKNIKVNEGSLVDVGANQEADVVLFKRDNDELDSLQDGIEAISKIGRPINGKRLSKLQDLLGKFQQFMDEVLPRTVKKEVRMELTEKLDAIEDEDVKKHLQELQDKADGNDELTTQVETLTKQVEDLTKEEEPEEDITKGASPELIKEFEELKKDASEAKELAKEEKEIRKSKEYTSEADKFEKIGSSEVLAKVLRLADENDIGEDFRTLVTAVDKRIEVTDEIGKSQTLDDNSPTAKLEVLAKARAEKDGITKEQAYTKVTQTPEGNELWEQAQKEVN